MQVKRIKIVTKSDKIFSIKVSFLTSFGMTGRKRGKKHIFEMNFNAFNLIFLFRFVKELTMGFLLKTVHPS
jgi:hypothetical protein